MTRRVRLTVAALVALGGFAAMVVAAAPVRAAALDLALVPRWGWQRHVLSAMGVACVAVAPGLARGRRLAWWVALAAVPATAASALINDSELPLVAPLALAFIGVAVSRRHFGGVADPQAGRSALAWLVIGEGVVFGYAAIGLYLLDANFRESTSIASSVLEGVRLLFLLPSGVVPSTAHGQWFLDSVRWLSVIVIAFAASRLVVPRRAGARAVRSRVEALLGRYAMSSIAPFHLLSDKRWCFSPDGQAFVGYALVDAYAVALGGPIGAPASRADALDAFMTECDRNGWGCCLHQVDDADATLLTDRGFRLLRIGDEAVVDIEGFTLSGRAAKSLRSALNMGQRAGITVDELSVPIDPVTMRELREVSDAWLDDSGHRERGFTLGSFDATALRDGPVLVARGPDQGIVAFANVIPSYKSAIGNFDLMRRRPDAPKGTMEMLFVALIERFRAEGKTGMSLGLAPLANVEGEGGLDRLLAAVRDHGGRAFNFIGLYEFKNKWHPTWEPRYLAYHGPAQLPRAALSVVRAGELYRRHAVQHAAGKILRRYPAAISLGGVVLWLMAATRGDPTFHEGLVRRFGLAWDDLAQLELWRLVTSALVNDQPGYMWSVLVLLVPGMLLAERRLGCRLTLGGFVLTDVVASLSVTLGLRLVAAVGSEEATGLLATRDAGSSAGAIGLLAAVAVTLPGRRAQLVGSAALGVALVTAAAIAPGVTNSEHLIAGLVGCVLAVAWRRRTQGQGTRSGGGRPVLGLPRRRRRVGA